MADALRRDALGTPGVVFLVLAAVAPLTGIVVIAALGIALGNGGGMPGAFLLSAVILVLFGVGYAQMSKVVTGAGGFYVYVTKGLGRPLGLVAALIALLGYNCFVAGAVGTSGFFTANVVEQVFGWHTPWPLWSLLSAVAVFALGRRGVDVSAKVLGVSLVLEVSILLVLDVAVALRTGLDVHAFAPGVVFSGSVGIAFLFAFNAFVGFEATGLFSEEARDPHRTISRATYTAIVLIGVFAAFTTWAIVSATSVDAAGASARDHLAAGDLVFSISRAHLGSFLTDVMMLLLVVSLFAALLALHNSATRYLFALGRSRVLPAVLGRTNAANGAPYVASGTQIGFATLVAAVYALAGLDPLADLTASMTGIGTLGVISLQALAGIAVVAFFRRRRDPRLWRTAVAPGLGGLGLITVTALAVFNFPTLAGSDAPAIALLPWLLAVAVAGGLGLAAWLRARRPEVYAGLDELGLDAEPAVP
ncbi:APC family permease [Amycolatopsis australiensis]|uniref:Amino acid transporter n=1 Tax=Amycolatopsis australiensis TaxID=546364 RepID=A0A1K1RYH1_9PSEU|nr:APC family permease [Amycolatopsis australiensis]SFW77121.1 Amino acid transporter [Amycolatopsis australiensis]